MHKAPEGCLSAMGTEFLVCGRYKDRFPSGFELEFWSHRLVSTDRVVFRLAFLHNTNSFQTVIFSATELLRLSSKAPNRKLAALSPFAQLINAIRRAVPQPAVKLRLVLELLSAPARHCRKGRFHFGQRGHTHPQFLELTDREHI